MSYKRHIEHIYSYDPRNCFPDTIPDVDFGIAQRVHRANVVLRLAYDAIELQRAVKSIYPIVSPTIDPTNADTASL